MAPRSTFPAALWLLACQACGGGGADPRVPCLEAQECGPAGDALCLESFCYPYDPGMGQARLALDLSFGRDMVEIAYSGLVHVLWPAFADGTPLGCAAVLAGEVDLNDARLNRMQAEPRYLVFNWVGGGTIFPGNLLQFLWPGEGLLVVAEGYYQLQAQGVRTALGCSQGVDLRAGLETELTVTMVRAP